MLAGKGLFSGAELPALRLQSLGFIDLAISTKHADVFRDRVDLGTDFVSFGLDVTQARIELSSVIDGVKQLRVATTRQCGLYTIEVSPQ